MVIIGEILPLPQGGVGRAKEQVTLGLYGGAAGVAEPQLPLILGRVVELDVQHFRPHVELYSGVCQGHLVS